MEVVRRLWQSRPSFLSVELENKGSVARDHLASERTYLAWLRTSLSLASLGIAIAQLFKLPELSESSAPLAFDSDQVTFFPQDISSFARYETLGRLGKPLGATCVALAAVCLLIGAYRFFLVQSYLIRGQYPPSRIEISFMSFSVGALIIAAFGVIVGANLKNSSSS